MLTHLTLKNIAIIDSLSLTFGPGLSVITGETGAGKSIIIEALSLLTGKKSDEDLIGSDSDHAIVDAVFTIPSTLITPDLAVFFDDKIDPNIDPNIDQNHDLIIHRKICRNKSNVIRINHQIVPLKHLKKIMAPFLQITSQHDTQHLFQTDYQRHLLDQFSGDPLLSTLHEYQTLYSRYQDTLSRYTKLCEDHQQQDQQRDYLRFQIDDIQQQSFTPTEEDDLNQQRTHAKHTHTLNTELNSLHTQFQTIQSALSSSKTSLQTLSAIDPCFDPILNTLSQHTIEYDDFLHTVSQSLHHESDMASLDIDHIESRLNTIFRYKTKYKVQCLPDLITLKDSLIQDCDDIENRSERSTQCQQDIQHLEQDLQRLATTLHDLRSHSSDSLCHYIQSQLLDLGFLSNQFHVEITPTQTFTAYGTDHITFLISPNPGEPLKPIQDIASGGELSRVMLAFKTIPHEHHPISVVFDEIDTGIGGETAHKIGNKVAQISENTQVFCVTHLAQIARLADHHFVVNKSSIDKQTQITVTELNETTKDPELVRMIGGADMQQLHHT